MRYLVTGSAGFIGFHLCRRLLERGHEVTGYDNLNPYYDVNLKRLRHRMLTDFSRFNVVEEDLCNREMLERTFSRQQPQRVCHLAAQVGVRYSLEHPEAYLESNLIGFFNVLETSRKYRVERLVYASSSSVYGACGKVPFSESQQLDTPVSFYAATKKSNELMAYVYSHLYGLQSIGLRLFSVYGPWGRPDTAVWLFTEEILKGEPTRIFNHGRQKRDFTYIDDIINGIEAALTRQDLARYEIFNLGRGESVSVLQLIKTLEDLLGRKAIKQMLPPQAGEMSETLADIERAGKLLDYRPQTSLEEGLRAFVDWYTGYRDRAD